MVPNSRYHLGCLKRILEFSYKNLDGANFVKLRKRAFLSMISPAITLAVPGALQIPFEAHR